MRRELRRWIDDMLGPLPDEEDDFEDDAASRLVPRLPNVLARPVDGCGGGARLADVVLVPGLAYLAVRGSDAMSSSNHYTVACRLHSKAPRFVCRPLAIVDGRPVENDGIAFEDADFTDHYVVDGDDERAVKEWLGDDVREALMQFPDLWLRVDGQTMTLSYYGYADAEMLDELIEAADIIFAEYGDGDGDPLFGDGPTKGAEKTRADEDEFDDDDVIEVLASVQDRLTAGVIDFTLYALGAVLLVAVLGHLPGFHPSTLFNSPDLSVAEPWQGGWTTKGFGALVIVESYLLGLVTWQAYLGVARGQSVGKLLIGLQVNRTEGSERTFVRFVLLRQWVFVGIPLAVAAALARPFSARAFFSNIPTRIPAAVALGVGLVLLVSWITSNKLSGIQDKIAGTQVVSCERYRLPTVQLGFWKNDPIVGRRLVWGAFMLIAFIGMNIVSVVWLDAWLLEVHQWR